MIGVLWATMSWLLAALVVTGLLLRVLGLDRGAVLVPAMALFPYALALALALVVIPLLTGNRVAAAVMTVGVLIGGLLVLPRTLGGPETAVIEGAPEFRVASLNVLFARADIAALLDIAGRSDLLALQEIDQAYVDRLGEAGLDDLLPHRLIDLRGGAGGSGVWSRYPLQGAGGADTVFATLRVRVDHPARPPLQVVAVHPVPPVGQQGAAIWARELELMADLAPVDVMLGDFNATHDHAAFREVLDQVMTDSAEVVGAGLRPTWSDGSTALPGLPLDHVLVGPGIRTLDFDIVSIAGSDHRAVTATLSVPDQSLSYPPGS